MKKKRLLCLLFSIVMAVGLIYPSSMGKVSAESAELGFTVTHADANGIDITADEDGKLNRIYVDTKIGRKKATTEMYKLKTGDTEKTVHIDLSYLNGKESTVKVYTRNNSDKAFTMNFKPQPKKLKGKFSAKTGVMEVTLAGSAVKPENVLCRIGRKTQGLSDWNFDNYYVKGVTAYISTKQSGEMTESVSVATSVTVTPGAKEVKVKIPAREKGPLAVIDANLIALAVQKGWVIKVANGDKIVSETATAAKKIDIAEFVSRASIDIATKPEDQTTSNAAIIEVYKAATDSKLESKTTEVIVPWQPILNPDLITASGISYVPLYNAGKTKQTGIKVSNKTSETFQVAILGKDQNVSDINLLETDKAKKLTWYDVKPNRTQSITGDRVVSGAQAVYRIKGVNATGNKLKLASTIVADPERIKVRETAKNEASLMSISNSTDVGGDKTVSYTALKINSIAGAASYAYAVRKRTVTGVKLDATIETLKKDYANESGTKFVTENVAADGLIAVEITEGEWIIVYAMDADGVVIAYSAKQVTKSEIINKL